MKRRLQLSERRYALILLIRFTRSSQLRNFYKISHLLVLAITLVLAVGPHVRSQTGNGITYIYDELGRLVGAVDPTGETVTYTYDATGNLLSLSRRSSSLVSIIHISPNKGSVGAPVTIYGTGFSPTLSENTVQFNGVAAPIVAATATRIIANVPSGATSGPISVITPSGSATSSSSFTLAESSADPPTISGFNPTIGDPGATVTISGTNFMEAVLDNRVRFNGGNHSVVSAAAHTSLTTSVPAGAVSGRISVTTPSGSATSSTDFFIPPAPYDLLPEKRCSHNESSLVNWQTRRTPYAEV